MKKNYHNQDIKRRLIALLTIAVFVFVMGFCPVSSVSAADTDEVQVLDSTEPMDDSEAVPEEQSLEETEAVDEEGYYQSSREGFGHIDIPELKARLSVDKSDEPSYLRKREASLNKALPAVHDPRDAAYYKNRVKMLNQGNTGTCWAHSVSTAAQISYLKELYDKSSLGSENYQLWPLDFAYNFYHRVPYKKYGYTYYDKNIAKSDTWKDIGSNNTLSSIAMSNWMGMHSENSHSYSDSNAYNNILVLENAMYVNDNTKYRYGTECYVLNQPLVKQAISEYGAVSAALNMEDYYYKSTGTYNGKRYDSIYCDFSFEKQYYPKYIGSTNHEIVLIGWDDNFPKENFKIQPAHDGAWIMQNSWGTEDVGKGFWYVSYDDYSLCSAVALDMQPADKYDANYQYDGNSCPGAEAFGMGAQMGNVFKVPDDGKRHTVEAVGFQSWNNYNTKYKVMVYKGVATKPSSGTLAATINVQTPSPGNYSFELSKYGASPVKLNTGEKFSVVVQPTSTNDSDNMFAIGAEGTDNFGWIAFKSKGKKQTSFFRNSTSAKWKDLYSYNKSESFRIKAFTTTVPRISLAGATVTLPSDNYDCTGAQIKPLPKVVLQGKTLVKGEDYTVSYTKNKYPGTAKLTVKGKGLYKGSVTKSFKIAAVQNFQQTGATSSSIKLGWDKSPKVNGYMVYKKISGKFKLVKTIKKNSTIKFTEKKLKANKEYQYKIRTYKKVGKKTYKGPLSPALVVRTEL